MSVKQDKRPKEVGVFFIGSPKRGKAFVFFTEYLESNPLTSTCPCCNKKAQYGMRVRLHHNVVNGKVCLLHNDCAKKAEEEGLHLASDVEIEDLALAFPGTPEGRRYQAALDQKKAFETKKRQHAEELRLARRSSWRRTNESNADRDYGSVKRASQKSPHRRTR